MTIFVVTVMYLKSETDTRPRCWGWFSRLEDAERAVIGNHTDMFEAAYYTHAVIEEMPEGLIPIAQNEYWFEATYGDGDGLGPRVKRVEKPASMALVIGFGMG
jgi:hypothetical protein